MTDKKIPTPPENASYEELDEYYNKYDTQELLDAGLMQEATSDEYQGIVKELGPKPKKIQINFRIDEKDLEVLKKIAEFKAIPYGTLARSWVIERLRSERKTVEQES